MQKAQSRRKLLLENASDEAVWARAEEALRAANAKWLERGSVFRFWRVRVFFERDAGYHITGERDLSLPHFGAHFYRCLVRGSVCAVLKRSDIGPGRQQVMISV